MHKKYNKTKTSKQKNSRNKNRSFVHSYSLKNRFLFIHEKRDKVFFMHSPMQNQKNIVLMYSSMHFHIKKKEILCTHLYILQKKLKNEK